MGSASEEEKGEDETAPLFENLPEARRIKSKATRVEAPIWTESKARLIAAYLRLFTFVTRHGAYIDGFAAPQSRDHTAVEAATEACAAKLVLHNQPLYLRNFWLCDADKAGIGALEEIKRTSPEMRGRVIEILHGDFNKTINKILNSGIITDTMATFCLLDQRTFECHWATLEKLAAHKQNGHKIELFYFLGTSWLDRAFGGTKDKAKITRWWGREDWTQLLAMTGPQRADAFAHRFVDELGYSHVQSWPICRRGTKGGNVMYHMIHCSDHERAPKLMDDAYRAVARPQEPNQISIWDLLGTAPTP
jgi:three-Cys-motif partner protein